MSSTKKTNVPSGWYRDPSTTGTLRYWDGEGWTQRRMHVQDQHQISAYALLSVLIPLAFFIAAPFAIYLGVRGLKEIDASGGNLTGRGWAISGIILGTLITVLMVLVAFVFLVNLNG